MKSDLPLDTIMRNNSRKTVRSDYKKKQQVQCTFRKRHGQCRKNNNKPSTGNKIQRAAKYSKTSEAPLIMGNQ